MDIKIENIKNEEIKFGFAIPWQVLPYIGYVGRLRGDFGPDDTEFWTTWEDGDRSLRTESFSEEFDNLINTLRNVNMPLNSRRDQRRYIRENPECKLMLKDREHEGMVRIDTDSYSYIIRLIPVEGDYNFYVFVYKKSLLDSYINKSSKGIRFIDKHYNDLFRIENGEKIVVDTYSGKQERVCWFTDEYHTLIGDNVYHICEFAEKAGEGNYKPKKEK